MADSILDSTKKVLGLDPAYTVFDPDIILHINSVFAALAQLGIGPEDGFDIEDSSATWVDFLGPNKQYNMAKSYVCLRVRMLFDPPTASFLLDAMQKQIDEIGWRLNILRESTQWIDPNSLPVDVFPGVVVLDGGRGV